MQPASETQYSRQSPIEWPTILLIIVTYGVLATLMWFYHALPFWVIMPVAAYFVALHGSLQHEVLHGHPTRNGLVNELMVSISPSLWFPYRRYRKLHLIHHNDDNLTDPRLDPESYYLLPDDWAKLSAVQRTLYTMNNTLAGRMIMGPVIFSIRFTAAELREMLNGNREVMAAWAWHVPACAVALIYALWICQIPLWGYIVMFAWPGIGFMLVRSFCEHQAVKDIGERTIIVESALPLSLMFLYNNLHVAHHTMPRMAWYNIPHYYRAERENLLKKNRGYLMHGYREIFRRFFLKPKEPVAYPHPEWLRNF